MQEFFIYSSLLFRLYIPSYISSCYLIGENSSIPRNLGLSPGGAYILLMTYPFWYNLREFPGILFLFYSILLVFDILSSLAFINFMVYSHLWMCSQYLFFKNYLARFVCLFALERSHFSGVRLWFWGFGNIEERRLLQSWTFFGKPDVPATSGTSCLSCNNLLHGSVIVAWVIVGT